MRLNVFVGLEGVWEIREKMTGDSRIATPEMVRFDIKENPLQTKVGFYETFSRVGFTDDVLSLIFKDISAKEGNICTRPNKTLLLLQVILDNAKPGTRFWLCKPANIEEWVENHIKFYEPVKNDKLINLIYGYDCQFNKDRLFRKIQSICRELDNLGDKLNLPPYQEFNFSDYYEDSVDSPVPSMLTRLYVKE